MKKYYFQPKKYLNGGYIGLIMLMIGVAIIALLIMRTDLFGGNLGGEKMGQSEGVAPLEGQNMIEQGKSAIDRANAAKALMEQNDRKAMEDSGQ